MTLSILDRYVGCLLGGAIGDQLGWYYEGLSSELLREHHGNITDFPTTQEISIWSDDTQQRVIVTQCLLDNNGTFNAPYFAQLLTQYFRSGQARSIGDTTRDALEKLDRGY